MDELGPGILARVSVDLKVAIETEGRLPEAVILVFEEPRSEDETAVRVNEYAQNARMERVLDAVASATRPGTDGIVGVLDETGQASRPKKASKRRTKKARVTEGEREGVKDRR